MGITVQNSHYIYLLKTQIKLRWIQLQCWIRSLKIFILHCPTPPRTYHTTSNLLTGSWGKGRDFWNACDLIKCQFSEHRDEYYMYRKDLHNFHNESIARSSIINKYFHIYVSKIAIYFFQHCIQGTRMQSVQIKLQWSIW